MKKEEGRKRLSSFEMIVNFFCVVVEVILSRNSSKDSF